MSFDLVPVAFRRTKESSVKNSGFSLERVETANEMREDLAQKELEPVQEATEVVASSGEDGICCIAAAVPEIVAAHPVFGFEMSDDGFDGGAPAQLAFDLGRHPRFCPDVKTLNLYSGGALWPR